MVVRISRVGEVHTHQFLMRWLFATIVAVMAPFVDVFIINISVPPLLVQHISNTVFVIVFSCSHEYVFVMCLPNV